MGPITFPPPALDAGSGRRTLEQAILRTVAYADVFDFPVTVAEIHRYLVGVSASANRVASVLAGMVPDRLEQRDGYYVLPGRVGLVGRRRRRAEAAKRLWPTARRYARRIAALPFVRMVAVTGSLARENAEPDGDIDYLIVTEPGRLWVCRALVGLLTRWAAARGVTLCANYYLAEDVLGLRERDVYTAHELAQMVPLAGAEAYRRLYFENTWAVDLLPNALGAGPVTGGRRIAANGGAGAARRLAESVLRLFAFDWLDRLERRRKLRKSIRQGHDLAEARFDPGCFKGHFDGHARRTLSAYSERLVSLEEGGA